MTLTEFLLARITEDEADLCDSSWTNAAGECNYCGAPSEKRRRAERAAKRRIVELCQMRAFFRDQPPEGADYDPSHDRGITEGLEFAVKVLALPYADHPDYREEWRP